MECKAERARDYVIERGKNPDFPSNVEIYHPNGQLILVLDEQWTDDQILTMLKFAIHMQEHGKSIGFQAAFEKVSEIAKQRPHANPIML